MWRYLLCGIAAFLLLLPAAGCKQEEEGYFYSHVLHSDQMGEWT